MMLGPEKVWKLRNRPAESIAALQASLGVSDKICHLLVNRGIDTFEAARDFFRPHKDLLHDPLLMKGMQAALDRIDRARKEGEKVMIYGDYDVDGTTSVAIVYDFFKKYYNRPGSDCVHFYIPHRYNEGYGLSFKGLDEAQALGCTLLITLDCGTKETEKIAYANSLGMDVIVCDHHTPSDPLPPAFALLNPKQDGCPYPFKELSACGIGYKLLTALASLWKTGAAAVSCYLDLVATSIAADIVPLTGENRVLAYLGLQKANENPCLALRALKNLSGFTRSFTISDLVFIISPKINAAGRMDDARKAVELFLADTEDTARAVARLLHSDNEERREVDRITTEEALTLMTAPAYARRKSTVIYKENWHKGVVGIVASRLIDHYHRPTIVLTRSNGKVTGSARSVAGFNIHDAIQQCGDLLDSFGGHFFAAGLTLSPENLDPFIEKFENVVTDTISEESLYPVIDIDTEISFSDITPKFYNILKQMQPFGPCNMRPVFITRGVRNRNSRIVKEAHIRFDLWQADRIFTGIGFNMASKFPLLQQDSFDMVYCIEENEWQGNTILQLRVLDIR